MNTNFSIDYDVYPASPKTRNEKCSDAEKNFEAALYRAAHLSALMTILQQVNLREIKSEKDFNNLDHAVRQLGQICGLIADGLYGNLEELRPIIFPTD